MVDVSPVLSTETVDATESAPADTQVAEAGRTVTVTEPQPQFTTIQPLAPDEALQLDFDPEAVAKAEIKDGNLEITFDNGGIVVVQGYEAWAQAGGQATDPQGGGVDIAQLGQASGATAQTGADQPAVCEIPNAKVVDIPVPAPGERIAIAAGPGDVLRLACSFRDVTGTEDGDNLEMTFPGGGVVVVENFSAWIAAQGATITDCVCGGLNLAEFVVAIGLSPEDVLPAAGEGPQGGPQGNDLGGSGFTPGPGPQILTGYAYPHILDPSGLSYGLPEPQESLFPVDNDNHDEKPTLDVPAAGEDGTQVFEKGLPARGLEPEGSGEAADPAPESDDSETTAGTITFTEGDSPATVTIDGVAVTAVGQTFAGLFGTLTVTGIGAGSIEYSYTLKDNTSGDNTKDDFAVVVTDKDGDSASSTLVIDIIDDVPIAANETISTADPQSLNIVILFDRSGSMDENPNVNGYSTRIDLARAAVAALLDTYGSFADVNVMVVDFANDANNSGWGSIEDANAYLAALEANGETHYSAAIQETMDTYNDGLPAADRSLVYFVSDGKPFPANTSLQSQGLVDDWEEFLDENNIEQAFSIGVGNGIPANDPDLEAVANKDANNDGVDDGPSAVVVTENLLLNTLVSTVTNTVSGNVLANDQFGADGTGSPPISSIEIAGVTYIFDGTDIRRQSDNAIIVAGDSVLIIATGVAGGLLTFDFNTGAFSYNVPDSNTDETFLYTIVDDDGNTATGSLTFENTASGIQQPHVVFGNNNNNNLNGQETNGIDIIGGDDGNDTASGGDGDDHITGGAGADSLSGGSGNDIIIGGSQSEVQDQAGVIRAPDGDDTLVGGEGADVLIGNQGDDLIIIGVGDNDTVIGGDSGSVNIGDSNGDILAFNGNLNLTKVPNADISGIERVSMLDSHGGAGADALTLNAADVISMGTGEFDPSGSFNPSGPVNLGTLDNNDAVRIEGEAGDTLNLSGGGWFLVGAADTRGGPAGYNLYVHAGSNTAENAYVIVDTDVTVNPS